MEKRRGGGRRKKVCQFCLQKEQNGSVEIDYKDVETLKKYITERSSLSVLQVTVLYIRELLQLQLREQDRLPCSLTQLTDCNLKIKYKAIKRNRIQRELDPVFV